MSQIAESLPKYIQSLNAQQLEAVTITEGPLLVLAGAGTGKTKVLTSRIAHILHERLAFPSQILAVTFTNKAAKEMRNRIDALVDGSADGLWLGTFHAIAAKILRRHADMVGLSSDFTIIDQDDQIRLVKQILADFNIDDKKNPPRGLIYAISRFKDKAWGVDAVPESEVGQFALGRTRELYAEYQKRLKGLNAVDFGDLTLYNIELFNKNPDVLREYHNKFKYILVDEYQDTNVAQYLWLRILAQHSHNICCVGDDDQSIYGWRGAEVANILRFDKDFPDAKIIRLEKNYRSTNHILTAAAELISNNCDRHGKRLWTDGEDGHMLKLNSFYDDREEARYVAEEIEAARYRSKLPYSEVAILVRAGYQTRSFEESLNFLRIPYRIVGGLKFYERQEIRDVLAYIRVLVNPTDSLAFERIINTPRRGIGPAAIQKIQALSAQEAIGYFEAMKYLVANGEFKGKLAEAMNEMSESFGNFGQQLARESHWRVVGEMLEANGYLDMWRNDTNEDARERVENIKELLRSLQDYTNLREYLEHVSLVSDTDNVQDDDKVSVMTMHASKGLEFDMVFLAGWEEGTFPSQRAIDENGKSALEEERRLAYVGMTRAKCNLYISYACNRRIYGGFQPCVPSRFIDELPSSTYEIVNNYTNYKRSREMGESAAASRLGQRVAAQASASHNKTLEGFKLGARVFSDKFGYGKVVGIKGSVVDVLFEKAGIKKMLSEYLTIA